MRALTLTGVKRTIRFRESINRKSYACPDLLVQPNPAQNITPPNASMPRPRRQVGSVSGVLPWLTTPDLTAVEDLTPPYSQQSRTTDTQYEPCST